MHRSKRHFHSFDEREQLCRRFEAERSSESDFENM
jgi:hypothetical protein